MFRTLILALAVLAPFASAQADDQACTETAPCEWVVEVDADGFTWNTVDGPIYNGTVGDWYVFSILNADDVEHTLTLEGFGLSWAVAGPDLYDTAPFPLDREGQFLLNDAQTGDHAVINVFLGDVVDQEQGAAGDAGTPGVNQPSLGVALVAIGLVAFVAFARR